MAWQRLKVGVRRQWCLSVLLFTLYPISLSAQALLNSMQVNQEDELRQHRREVTRMQQSLFRLQAFAESLKSDPELRSLVEANASNESAWQSPMARTRLRLQDVLDHSADWMDNVNNLAVDWIDSTVQSHALTGASSVADESQYLWLSASVLSVSVGVALVSHLEQVVAPYPFKVQGCGYRLASNSSQIEMRCLVLLTAWQLPMPILTGTAVTHSKIPSKTTTIETLEQPWQLFKQVTQPTSVQNSAKESQRAPVISDTKPSIRAKGIFTGPAGILVIHGG